MATTKFQIALTEMETRLRRWRIGVKKENKCGQATFTIRYATRSPVKISDRISSRPDSVKYPCIKSD